MTAPASLPDLLAHRARLDPGAIVAFFGERAISAGELDRRSSQVAAGLARLGIGAGDAVGVWLPNTPTWLEVHFALAKLGAVLVSLNTRYRSFDLGAVIARSQARMLVMQPAFRSVDFARTLAGVDAQACGTLERLVVDGTLSSAAPHALPVTSYDGLADAACSPAAPGDLADRGVIAFPSSGSTGEPKLILHGQRAVAGHAHDVAGRFFADDDAVALVALPLCGVFGYTTFMGALAAGRPAVIMDAFDAQRAVSLIERHAITTVTGPDVVMVSLLEAAEDPGALASWSQGGFSVQAHDNVDVVRRGDEAGVELFQCYGSSEFQGLLSRQPPGAPAAERALAGGVPVSPAFAVRVRSTEDDTLLTEPGVVGLLELRGPSFMLGYLHEPERTAQAVTDDGWFRTGDIGYRTGEGQRFVFLGRNNDALRLGGFLVEPREIERFLERRDDVRSAQVVAIETERGPQPVAFVIAASDEIAEQDVIDDCAAGLAAYKVPVRVFAVDAYPVTTSPNGEKVQRAKLRDQATALMAEGATR